MDSVARLSYTPSTPVATAAALQVDACTPNFLIQELYPYRVPEHFAAVDHAPELGVKNGFVPIPARPGLGLGLVEEKMRPHLWTTIKL
jgi:galactonate dehydratase